MAKCKRIVGCKLCVRILGAAPRPERLLDLRVCLHEGLCVFRAPHPARVMSLVSDSFRWSPQLKSHGETEVGANHVDHDRAIAICEGKPPEGEELCTHREHPNAPLRCQALDVRGEVQNTHPTVLQEGHEVPETDEHHEDHTNVEVGANHVDHDRAAAICEVKPLEEEELCKHREHPNAPLHPQARDGRL